eukprot:UN25408
MDSARYIEPSRRKPNTTTLMTWNFESFTQTLCHSYCFQRRNAFERGRRRVTFFTRCFYYYSPSWIQCFNHSIPILPLLYLVLINILNS